MEQALIKWCEFERRITMLETNLQQTANQLQSVRQDTQTRFDNAAKTFNKIDTQLTQLEKN